MANKNFGRTVFKMTLKIIKKNNKEVEVRLSDGEGALDMLIMPLDFKFDTMLVTSIDKILKRNRIDRVSPLDVQMEGFEEESSMATLITRSVIAALKIS